MCKWSETGQRGMKLSQTQMHREMYRYIGLKHAHTHTQHPLPNWGKCWFGWNAFCYNFIYTHAHTDITHKPIKHFNAEKKFFSVLVSISFVSCEKKNQQKKYYRSSIKTARRVSELEKRKNERRRRGDENGIHLCWRNSLREYIHQNQMYQKMKTIIKRKWCERERANIT